jgi:CheY-like chemotaxis protein
LGPFSDDAAPDETGQAADREAELARLAKELPTEPVALCDIVAKVQETLQPLLRAIAVSLRCHAPDSLPALAVQETAARQAFLHLATLAARCVPGGRVRIEGDARPTSAEAHVQIEALRATVADIHHISEGDLALARRLVEIAGGEFTCRLDADAQAPFLAEIRLPLAAQIPVLAVDDNSDTLALLRRYLTGTPYRFTGTTDPAAVLPLAGEINPAAIIVDIMLPGMDGWELLGRLRQIPKLEGVPVIVSTVLPYEQLASTLGAAEFLPKPVSREALLSALDRWVRRRRTGSR